MKKGRCDFSHRPALARVLVVHLSPGELENEWFFAQVPYSDPGEVLPKSIPVVFSWDDGNIFFSAILVSSVDHEARFFLGYQTEVKLVSVTSTDEELFGPDGGVSRHNDLGVHHRSDFLSPSNCDSHLSFKWSCVVSISAPALLARNPRCGALLLEEPLRKIGVALERAQIEVDVRVDSSERISFKLVDALHNLESAHCRRTGVAQGNLVNRVAILPIPRFTCRNPRQEGGGSESILDIGDVGPRLIFPRTARGTCIH